MAVGWHTGHAGAFRAVSQPLVVANRWDTAWNVSVVLCPLCHLVAIVSNFYFIPKNPKNVSFMGRWTIFSFLCSYAVVQERFMLILDLLPQRLDNEGFPPSSPH